jgi:hypothetical protein
MKSIDFLNEGNGILRLKPTWVPRSFCRPGKRIKLHPDDYYVLGLERGGIDERWLSSTTWAENGPNTPSDEGMSYVVSKNGEKGGFDIYKNGKVLFYGPAFVFDFTTETVLAQDLYRFLLAFNCNTFEDIISLGVPIEITGLETEEEFEQFFEAAGFNK